MQTIPASLAGTPVTITETCPTTDFTPSFMGYDVNRIGLQASGSDKLDFQITDLRVFRNTNQVGGSFEIIASDPSGQGTGSLEVRPILECTQIVLTN